MSDDTTVLPPPRTKELASVFDRLVDSNIQLTTSVGKLVRLTYGVLAFNAVLVCIVITIMLRHP